MKKSDMKKGAAHPNVDMKGVHKPVSDMTIKEIPKGGRHLLDHTGRSSMGTATRSGNISAAKTHSVLSEMKQMPKPNLPKSEDGMEKDDMPHEAGSPEDSAHDVVEEHSSLQEELADLTPEEQAEMLAHLRMLKDKRELRSPENKAVGADSNSPEMDKADKTKHDRCVEEVSKDPSIDNPHAVCVAAGVEPSKWKKSEGMVKSEYSAAEVALEILKKAESMYKAKSQLWDDHKTDKRIEDLPMAQTREVLNENDIVNAVSQKLTDNSVQRLKQYLAGRKSKKEKK